MNEKYSDSRRIFIKNAISIIGISFIPSSFISSFANIEHVDIKQLNIPKAYHIEWIQENCIGCTKCVLACALVHGGSINPELSAIKWENEYLNKFEIEALICQQCNDPVCYTICHEQGGGAFYIDQKTNARCINKDICIGCKKCIDKCNSHIGKARINFNTTDNIAVKCDLCSHRENGPACIEVCSEVSGNFALKIKLEE